ncbi:MAG TPA: 4Fe-4S binding protein [Clostridia bacterium]|nr:4Fe-4S binding protein [Clostridia bacterium]
MYEIVIISGKGGTGKTSVAGCFAALAGNAVLADCDVDAANLHLILGAKQREAYEFSASKKAEIHDALCVRCGACRDVCRFDAVSETSEAGEFKIDPLSCEGCGVCFYTCPRQAISMKEAVSGRWFISDTPYGIMVHAALRAGEGNSGKLVTLVKNKARELAEADGVRYVITDGPPGVGCPVIASLTGATVALIVTEPTRSAIHDMKRVLQVCRHFGVPASVCINRCDLSKENTAEIMRYCHEEGIHVIGEIPFDRAVVDAMVKGLPAVQYVECEASRRIRNMWEELKTGLAEKSDG